MTVSMQKELVRIKSDSAYMEGMLELPANPIGMVLFAHGSGSSRLSPRNNYVAGELRKERAMAAASSAPARHARGGQPRGGARPAGKAARPSGKRHR